MIITILVQAFITVATLRYKLESSPKRACRVGCCGMKRHNNSCSKHAHTYMHEIFCIFPPLFQLRTTHTYIYTYIKINAYKCTLLHVHEITVHEQIKCL